MAQVKQMASIALVVAVGVILISAVTLTVLPFGTFPQRQIGSNVEPSVGQSFLEDAPQQTGATNVVTSIVWGYRGYDTLGETTVLFTAVVGVMMVFRALGREE